MTDYDKENFQNGINNGILNERKEMKTRFEIAEEHLSKNIKKIEKTDKSKVIRDAFTMPQSDHEYLKILRKKALNLGIDINKSELVRAGIKLLNDLSDNDFIKRCQQIERLKPGRTEKL